MSASPTPPRPLLKRSRRLVLTTVIASAGVSLAACDAPGASADWNSPPAVQIEQGAPLNAHTYASLAACKAANEVPDEACEQAAKAAVADQDKTAPRFAERATCEDVYGAGQCVPNTQAGQGSFFTPLLTGFVIGQLMNGGFRGGALYRDQRDGGLYTGYGGRVFNDYSTGRTQIGTNGLDPPAAIREAPPKIQTRTSVLSRGGFGGRMSAHSYGGGGFGA
ncbi:DUF1190 domain-containing protein [Phenylobacterium sp.]|jgi:uncharacterized protein YgiB involved in biofilm formation|uniref:DUF1190 domain-containing protein n=1 Tax=Phenylobacterium sp. TaxID=1871053 RepID=UPI002F428372